MIISCHILQFFGNGLAWWLNCGVQLFLGMSGFIYGQKEVVDTYEFIKKRFVRILKEYYICILISLIMYLWFAIEYIDIGGVIDLLFCSGTIEGLGHLWFIGTILFCYILTPGFSKVLDECLKKEKYLSHISILMSLIILHILIERIIPHFQAEWIVCYFFGFIIGREKMKGGGIRKHMLLYCR